MYQSYVGWECVKNMTSYRKFIIGVLKVLNYDVGNENGNFCVGLNIVNLFLAMIYLAVSIYFLTAATAITLGLHLTTYLSRVFKEFISNKKLYAKYEEEYKVRPNYKMKSPNMMQAFFLIVALVLFFIIGIFSFGQVQTMDGISIIIKVFFVISFLYSFLEINVSLFEASASLNTTSS